MFRVLLFVVLAYIAARMLWRVLVGVFEGLGYQAPDAKTQSVGLVHPAVQGADLRERIEHALLLFREVPPRLRG